MHAMYLDKLVDLRVEREPLQLVECPIPEPGPGEVRIRVASCGVCHTELDEIEGRTPPVSLPVILGHQAVGRIDQIGPQVSEKYLSERVGVAWIYSACGICRWCRTGRENLCPEFRATGRDVNGGYAEYMVVPMAFTHPIPELFTAAEAAPLLCAGAIGYRSLRLAQLQPGAPLGLTGFGASAHLMLKLARHQYPDLQVYVFARSEQERQFARDLGAAWAGGSDEQAPGLMQAIIDTTPAWKPVADALRQLEPGGRLVINAIRKEKQDQAFLGELDYPRDLWLEKTIQSVANVSRADVREFLALAAEIPLHPTIEEFPLAEANRALLELKEGKIQGAKVLRIGPAT
ncbi:alcohol dehydrogenase catalytic domain-containing protein [Geopsychrobacter electrodiphilus]|uniref:alcohol dehydrogenase catalytic domain-containing protein n=1 Tax=Geopsychrobacter electrodiphilus TaxID=225196 RepID=UPI000477BF89